MGCCLGPHTCSTTRLHGEKMQSTGQGCWAQVRVAGHRSGMLDSGQGCWAYMRPLGLIPRPHKDSSEPDYSIRGVLSKSDGKEDRKRLYVLPGVEKVSALEVAVSGVGGNSPCWLPASARMNGPWAMNSPILQ